MHSSKKGNQWYVGLKAYTSVDADSGLVHTVRGTSGRVADITEGNSLLHGQEADVFRIPATKVPTKTLMPSQACTRIWPCVQASAGSWSRTTPPSTHSLKKEEKLKAGVRARVEHPFRVIKRQFGYANMRPGFEEKHAAAQDAVCTVPACG
jgi:IS5 family transposase